MLGFAAGVGFEGLAQLQRILGRGLPESDIVRENNLEACGDQYSTDLFLFTRAARSRQQLHQPRTCFWARNNSLIPRPARSTKVSSCSRENVECSPVPCTSTKSSGSAMTIFASTPASLSSA